jgi:hypothetical protein
MQAIPDGCRTAADFRRHYMAARARIRAKALPTGFETLDRVQRAQHAGKAIIYAAPIGPRKPQWHPLARILYSYAIGPHHIILLETPPSRKMTAKEIVRNVAAEYGIRVEDLTGPRRHKNFIEARFKAIGQMYVETKLSISQIGQIVGDRDHTSVLHALRRLGLRQRALSERGPHR